jgi:hypothetical protein
MKAIILLFSLLLSATYSMPKDNLEEDIICTNWYRRDAPIQNPGNTCTQVEYKTCQIADGSYLTFTRERSVNCEQ